MRHVHPHQPEDAFIALEKEVRAQELWKTGDERGDRERCEIAPRWNHTIRG